MLAIQLAVARYQCLYIQGARAFQMRQLFFDPPGGVKTIVINSAIGTLQRLLCTFFIGS